MAVEKIRHIHVVVVGISGAGIGVSKALATLARDEGYPNLQVTMVDANPYYYHLLGAPRGLVDKEYAQRQFFRLDGLLASLEVDPTRPQHRFIHARLTNIEGGKVVELSTGERLSFDYLVLATGAQNAFPANVRAGSIEEARQRVAQLHEDVARAKSILVIGGGAVGVEMAGEIAQEYKKKVTLVHSSSRLLPLNFKPGLSNGAVYKLRQLGVDVVLNERVEVPEALEFTGTLRPLVLKGKSGREYPSDLQLLATGTKLRTEYMEGLELQLGNLREPNGAIKVRSTLQLDTDTLPTVFVVGDVNSLPQGAKYLVKAAEQSKLAAANISEMIRKGVDCNGGGEAKLQVWNGSLMNMIAVPIGRYMGVGQFVGLAFGKSRVGDYLLRMTKNKDYFLSKVAAEFPTDANS
ncbi:hypothetical protein GGF46_002609 [Coemansia sp. RSA 552]|nr:hypothetical protein GGF46_002609 [Coemansia sp. RSA 552]